MIITCQEVLEDYLFHHVLSPTSEANYRLAVGKLGSAVATEVDGISPGELLAWRRAELSKGLSATSWNT